MQKCCLNNKTYYAIKEDIIIYIDQIFYIRLLQFTAV